ncbi:MAG: alanine racemase [Solirubrobacteraceae bacterium]
MASSLAQPTSMNIGRVRELAALPIPVGTKGVPLRPGLMLGDAARMGWRVLDGDVPMPVLVLKEGALANNLAAMAAYAERVGALLCPHGKTTMAPQLFARQIEAGAWGLTAATPVHLALYRHYGVQRILYANQLVEPQVINWLDQELADDPDFEFYCLVDSPAAVEALDGGLRAAGRAVNVLIEIGYPGGRCGVRDLDGARRLADAVEGSRRLSLTGIECFEGLIARTTTDATIRAVDEFLSFTDAVARDLIARTTLREAETVLVSAGGSAYFDRVTVAFDVAGSRGARTRLILRSGCYLTQDGGFYDSVSPLAGRADVAVLRDAIEVWSTVLSRPEPSLLITSMGRRDVPYDLGLPKAVRSAKPGAGARPLDGAEVKGLNDQHAHITVPADSTLSPGDLVGCTISHPCGAFDRWRVILVVDDGYRVTEAIATCF